MSGLADLVKQAIAANGDLPVTHGVERWIEDGMQYDETSIATVQALVEADCRRPVHERKVAPLDTWELWRWLAMGLSGGWLRAGTVWPDWQADGVLNVPGAFGTTLQLFYLQPVTAREFQIAARGGPLADEALIRVELDRIRHGIPTDAKASVVLVNRDTTEWREWRVTHDRSAYLMARMRANGHTNRYVFAPYIPPVAGSRFITDRVNAWLDAGAVYSDESIEMVLDVMYEEAVTGHLSGAGRFRTSRIGDDCLRKQQLSFLGWPQDQETTFALNRMENGSWGHLAWQANGLAARFLFDIEVMYSIPDWYISGPMDGQCIDGAGFELKTTNSRTFGAVMAKWEPKEDHLFQITTAMIAKGLSKYRVVYVNRDDGTWVEIEVPLREDYVQALKNRMGTVLGAMERRELLPMYHRDARSSCVSRAGSKYKNCEFATVCSTAEFRRFM